MKRIIVLPLILVGVLTIVALALITFPRFSRTVGRISVERQAKSPFEQSLIEKAEAQSCPAELRECLDGSFLRNQIELTKARNKGVDVPADKQGHLFELTYRARLDPFPSNDGIWYFSASGERVTSLECISLAGDNPHAVDQSLATGSRREIGYHGSGVTEYRYTLFTAGGNFVCQAMSDPKIKTQWIE